MLPSGLGRPRAAVAEVFEVSYAGPFVVRVIRAAVGNVLAHPARFAARAAALKAAAVDIALVAVFHAVGAGTGGALAAGGAVIALALIVRGTGSAVGAPSAFDLAAG